MNRPARILAVTAGLAAAGAVFGAVAGVVALAIALALTDGASAAFDAGFLAFAALFGAVFGACAAPAAGWLLLRRVPLGLAALGGVTGTVVGGVVGWVLPGISFQVERALLGALLGFVGAAVVLRRRASARSATPAEHGGGA